MRILITTIFSLLLLATFVAPVVIDVNSVDLGVAMAQVTSSDISNTGSVGFVEKNFTKLLQSIAVLFLNIGALFLWVAGALFNFGIKYSIIEFAGLANIPGVLIAWAVLRDVANMFFIFIFLAIGIGTILNLQQYNIKKLLPVLLAVAILINFSLFFTRATIDIAHGFAGAILNQSGVVITECDNEENCLIKQGIATAFIQQLGLVSIFGNSVDTTLGANARERQGELERSENSIFTGTSASDGGRALAFGFFGFIFLSAAAIVFLAGAVLLIMRIIKLLLLMIASGPAMAAYILPSTRKHFDKWLQSLIQEAFFAPILLLLISISLLFLNSARESAFFGNSNDQSFAEIFVNGNLDSMNIIVIFLIALGLLFMSIKVAGDMGVSGAKAAMSVQNFGTRRLAGVTSGAVALAGRSTIGRAGSAASAAVRSSKFGRSTVGRLTAKSFDKVGDSSFDGRAGAGKLLGKKVVQNVAGKPVEGFTSSVKARVKDEKKYAKTLGLTREERGEKTRLKDEFKTLEETSKETLTNPETPEGEKAQVRKNLARAKEKLKDDKRVIDQTPQKEYAQKLEDEVSTVPIIGLKIPKAIGKIRKKELSSGAAKAEADIKNLLSEIETQKAKLDAETGAVRKNLLQTKIDNLERELEEVKDIKTELQASGKYTERRTGDYRTGPIHLTGTGAAGKLAASQAINKELNKSSDKKNLDTLINTLKESSGGSDKKEEV